MAAVSPEAPGVNPIERASQVKAQHEDALLSLPGVVGAGVGLAPDSDEAVIEVYVASLTEQLSQSIPDTLEGVRVRIVATGSFSPR